MAMSLLGQIDWNLTTSKDSHRDYKIKWLCYSSTGADGPASVINTPGLPAIGSTWAFGTDVDLWAYAWPTATVKPIVTKEINRYWIVEQLFSTKPTSRCQDTQIENPLNEPDGLSGSFVKYTQEISKDRHGNKIASSSHERIRGSIVEFDNNRPTVIVQKNLISLPMATYAPMVDTVNDGGMWGLDTRMVKLSNVQWERKTYGVCTFYYTVTYEFDVDYTTFDRVTWDEGTKVLSQGGDADNPKHFKQYEDENGANTRVFLDGAGSALSDGNNPVDIDIEHYEESDFFVLGIPATL